ncbi:TetR/AcrR family transcriptional regulator [Rhodococcus wratislaviensis]|uniref:TetR/AcrR family transcriptional regulator n=1 Tax=Rhodococcus wratislaviensis TaxID=44752 RepID=UPI003662AB3E
MPHVPAAERRRQIIEAATRVISREGVAKATTRRIGEEARANIGTLHYTFNGKEDLFEAVFAYCWDVTSEIVEDAVDATSSAVDAASEILGRYGELAIADPDLIAAQYQLLNWSMTRDGGLEQADSTYRQQDELIMQALRRGRSEVDLGVDEEGLARLIVALLDGICLRFLVGRSADQCRADLGVATQLVRAAFSPEVSAPTS